MREMPQRLCLHRLCFHDIGLPGDDRGRGAVLRLEVAEHAFKTPGLREIGRSAPYMHDGSLATLADVLRHYASGVVDRATLSKDITRGLTLSDAERAALIAFLGTLTSEGSPAPPVEIVPVTSGPSAPAEQVSTVSQDDKAFHPTHIALARGGRLWIVNNDTRTTMSVSSIPRSTSIPAPRSRARPSRSSSPRPDRSWSSAASIPR